MNFAQAANIDRLVGKWLLKFVSLFPPRPKQILANNTFKKILVVKFWGMGTILEATPLFRSLKLKYPDASLDLLTYSENKKIIESLGLFQNVHGIDSQMQKGFFSFLLQTMRFILAYRRNYSLIIDLEFFAHFSALVTKILGSDYSLGFESFVTPRNYCYSRTIIFDHSSHIRVIFLKFLDALCIAMPADIILSAPYIPKEKKLEALEKFPLLEGNYMQIAINIASNELCLNRRWPEENFRKLIGFIQQDYDNLQIYLVGGKDDVATVDAFYKSLPDKRGVHITAGRLDILGFSYALSKMFSLITNDSGPVHIAEALKIPVVCFYGPETPNLYGPMSDRSLVFYKNIYCSPCLNVYNHKRTKCRDNQCLKLITAEDVYKEMRLKILRRSL